jgi:tetratricopeptide (TPR) repeat protein
MLRSQVETYLGWFDAAVADADALVRRSAAPVPVLAHRCRILASANRNLDQALRDCNRSLSMDPTYDEGYLSRALLRLRRGENDLAIRDFNQALRRNDALAEARYGRGVALDRKGDTAAANADFAAARAIEPEVEEQFAKLGLGPATANRE